MIVEVVGHAVQQGSMVRGRHGGIYHAKTKKLNEWRAEVKAATWKRMQELGVERINAPAPVRLDASFWFKRPNGHYRKDGSLSAEGLRIPHPTKVSVPDRDKLLRSVQDALTGVLYDDDSQVVAGTTDVLYADRGSPERLQIEVSVWVTDSADPTRGRWQYLEWRQRFTDWRGETET